MLCVFMTSMILNFDRMTNMLMAGVSLVSFTHSFYLVSGDCILVTILVFLCIFNKGSLLFIAKKRKRIYLNNVYFTNLNILTNDKLHKNISCLFCKLYSIFMMLLFTNVMKLCHTLWKRTWIRFLHFSRCWV